MEKLLLRVNYIRILLFTLLYLSTTQFSLGQPCPSVIPALGVTTMGQNIVCELPGKIEFKISGYEDISSNLGANYYINFGDGKYVGTVEIDGSPFNYQTHLTNEQLKAKNGVIEYTYDETYCGKPFAENNKKWVVQVRVVGCDPTLSQLGSTSMLLQQAGTADFLHSNKCDYSICFENISRSFINHQCQETFLFEWDFGDGTKRNQVNESQPVEMSFCHEYKCAGKYDVTLNAFSGYEIIEESGSYVAVGSSCGSDNITKEILVLPKPKLKKKSNINVCTGENVDEVKLQDLDVCTYDWYDKASKQCKPTDVCGILGEKVAYAFNYKVTGDYVGLDLGEYNVQEEDAKIPSFKAINNSDVAKKVKICITPYNELGCPGEEMCYEIVVHPSAKISNLKDVSFCDNTTAKINPFQSSISGVTYEWSVKSGDWSAIGLPSASGTGHMPTFTAKNSTSSPITVTIEVVANSSLCKGSVGEFKITVYPLPKYDIASQSPTTCNGTDGWIEFKNLGLNVTKYLVKYKKDGTDVEKTINVQGSSVKVTGLSKGSYTDIKIAAFGSECFVGTTDITLVDPPIPNVPVISSNSPVCIGENLILKVDNADADISSWKWTGPSCTSGGAVPSTLKEPTPKPMQYCMAGEYTLEVERNKCYSSSKITVTYREDPEVTLSALASVCVGSSFKIDDEVAYNWKRIPLADQKIKWEIINDQGTVVTTQNNIQYPSFTINLAGDYTVKVTLEGFGCNGTKLVAEQPIKVKQVNYTLDVKADKNQICANEKVEFTNNTSKNDEIKYNWTVSPTTGVVFSDGTTKTSDAPKILFQEPGKYTVEVVADNECTKRTQTFNINVRKNPTVVLNKLPDLCSGKTFNEVNDYVTYTWNNVEGETPVWSATPADGVVFSDPNSNYPTITYTKAGNYTIKVEMPDISCGIKSYAESSVKVYDGSFTVDITQDNTVICEGKEVGFVNKTVSTDPIKYEWSVSPSNGVVISDATNASPKIRFNKYGDFVISVLIDGICQDETKTFDVRVNKDPEVTFSPLGFTCTNKTFTLTSDLVSYVWNSVKETEKKVTWSVLDNTGASAASTAYTIDNVNALYPVLTFNTSGTYTLKVEVDGLGCSGTKTKAESELIVYDNTFVLDIVQDKDVICENEKVSFTNQTTSSDPLDYTWSVSSMDGVTISDAKSTAPSITFTKYGDYVVTVVMDGKCSDQTKTFNVRVNKDPEVTFSPLGFTCTNKTFTLTSDLVSYVWNSVKETEKKVTWSVLDNTGAEAAATAYTIDNANALYPVLTFNTSGTYTLKVEVDGLGCNGTKTKAESKLIVYDNTFVLDIVQDKNVICENEKVSFTNNTISSDPLDYTWSVSSMDGVTISDVKSTAPEITFTKYGDYVVTVVMDGKCSDQTKTFNVRVNKDPEVTFNPLGFTCTNKTFTLTSDLVSYVWNSVKDTEKKVTWSILDATGAEAAATAYTIDNANALYPELKFNTSGTYKLKVEVDGLGCNGIKTKAESELIVYDNTFVLDIVQDKDVICENEKVSFTNNTTSSDPLDYTWSVSSMDGVTISDAKSTAPSITFTKYGDYVVTVVMDGKCSDQTKTFNVRVNKDPEVTFSPLGFTCTNNTFTLTSDLVSYVWNSVKDTEKKVTWSILDETGAEAAATAYTIDNVNALYPVLAFNTSGTYTLKVEVDGLGCNGTKTKAEAELIVYDNTFVLDLTQDKDVICEGEKVSFTNNTTSSDPLDYTWSVSSMDGVTISDAKSTAPSITFTKYGDYVVTVVMDGKCSDQTKTFNVRVNKDPEVTFSPLGFTCTNKTFTFTDVLVSYVWNSVKDTEKKVTWSILDATGAEAAATAYTIDNVNALYPVLAFNTSGTYTLKVEVDGLGCNGTKTKAEAELIVYDNTFVLDIVQDKDVICENEKVSFTNNTISSDPLDYTWSVSSMDGVTISDAKSTAPEITFTKYGDYVVTVVMDGKCSDQTATYNVRVKKDPEVKFGTLETICNNNKFTFDNTKVVYTWYNMLDTEKEIEWTVTPNTGVTEEDTDKEYPSYTFTETGDYTITVKVKAMGCSQAYIEESVKVTVISDNLDLQVTAAPLEGCVPLDVTFTNTTSDTDEIAYKWIVDKSDENWDFKQGTETAKSPIITLINEDAYKISLEAKNKCNTKTLEFDIKAYDEVHFKLATIPIVCGEYIFDAKSEEQGLTVTGKTENIKSIKWVVYKSTDYTNINYQEAPTESYEFTSGNADDLYPVIKIKEWGKYKIELQTQTICNDETISTTVDIEKPIEITLTQPDPLCANIADEYGQNPYTLVADPTDGTWSWDMDVPAEQQEYLDAAGKLFYPNTPGTYKLKYSVKRQACYAEKSMDVVVKDYPTMDIGADIYVCEKDQTPVLLEGTPNDGVWTGNEVSKNGSEYYFNPPLTVGDYDITYTITDAFGCKNRDYKQAHIQPLPNPNFEPKAHCLPDPVTFIPVVDVTTHQFKLDYGDGTNGTDLTHLYGEIGNYDVKLIVTAPNGCVDSLTQVLLVEKYPDQKLIVSEHEGCSPFTPEIKIEYDYSDPNVEFLWDFGPFGKQTTEQPTPVEFTTVERDTTYQFSITVKNHCGEYTVTDTVRVLALPVAKMIPSIDHGCSPLNVDFKNISLGSIRGMNYTWDFGDGSPLEYDFRVSHKFTTDHKNDSTYKVMLVAENQCGTDTTYQDIYIIPPVVYPQIINPTPKVCVGDEVCILNETMEILPHSEIITYKWDFGNGKISDDPKDACTVYDEPSTYMITLNITTSCGSSETDVTYVEVQKQPDFKISAPDYVCHLDTVKPTISMLSKIREVSWDFGNGYSVKDIDPEYLYTEPGEYILTATATEDNFASCQASKSIPILVRELPNPEIEPLEADSCSPYVYKPKINGDVSYAIDYEDSGIIEANESHTYVNKGLEPIIYRTSIYLEDEYGCKSVKQGLVNVYPEPVASIAIVEVLEERPEVVTFASTSYGADVCRWTFPFAGKLETCKEVKESFYENKTETIYLEVANMYGCVDNDSIDYTPVFKGLYFPNTFSPNGVLEEVRTFNGVGLGLASYQLEIFDLYGNLIFKTTSLDANGSPNEGWDGRDRLGNLMPQDVYSWKVEAVYIDGSHYPYGNDVDNKEGHEVNDVTVQRGSVLLLHR